MKRKIILLLSCVCVLIFAVAAYQVYSIRRTAQDGQETYENLAGQHVTKVSAIPEQITSDIGAENASAAEEAEKIASPITVDFAELKSVNADIVGWIYLENTGVNFPVVQGEDNEYYLKHLIDGSYHRYGTVFEDCNNTRGVADGVTILYGHNMVDGAMFAEIVKYADQAYFDEHPVFWLLTPDMSYRVDLFSGYTTVNGDTDTYRIFSQPGEETEAYALERKELSDFKSNVTPTREDRLLMLSTCEYSGNNTRYVLFGVLRPCV